MRILVFFCFLTTSFFSCYNTEKIASQSTQSSEIVTLRLDQLSSKMLDYLPNLPLDSTRIPRSLEADGTLHAGKSGEWTSGFFPGILWQLYGHSKDVSINTAAEKWNAFIEKEKWDDHTHDLGFKVYGSFGKGYHITNNQAYKDIVIQASKTLIQRNNEKVGAIRSWDFNADIWEFPVIIDNMMNLDMLFEATRLTGDSIFHKIAYQHAKTTLENHFRNDNSSYHVVVFDTLSGNVLQKITHQGDNDESAWARGQAWGLYGFTMAYRWTKDPDFLNQAKSIAEYFFNHPNLPEDKIPYWDFDAPNIPNEPRDVSAATIAASALLELMEFDTENQTSYLKWVDEILHSLSQPEYQTNGLPFLLDHSAGNMPKNSEIDVPIIYADYYYVEALLRRKNL